MSLLLSVGIGCQIRGGRTQSGKVTRAKPHAKFVLQNSYLDLLELNQICMESGAAAHIRKSVRS